MADALGGVATVTGPEEGRAAETSAPARDWMPRIEKHPQWNILAKLPMQMIVAVPIASFKVKDLLVLEAGQMIRSSWKTSEDVPIAIASVKLAVCEFEVVDQHLAVRVTRLVAI